MQHIYFELTILPEQLAGVANVHLDALEHQDNIAFMHAVQEGAASKSYGLAVAALAGVPKNVIKLAKQKLNQLENLSQLNPTATQSAVSDLRVLNQMQGSLDLLEEEDSKSAIIDMLKELDPDELSPKQALSYLYQLKKLV